MSARVRVGSSVCWMPSRDSRACTCFAVFYIAMNGGAMINQPKIIVMSECMGLMV